MNLEKKLIACSILAITIGIATIAPLAFFMSPAKAQTTPDKPWFNLTIPYAFCTATATSEPEAFVTAKYAIGLDYTVNPDAVDTQTGARIEYYQLQVYSDQAQITNITAYMWVNCTEPVDPASFQFARADWFNTTATSTGSGVLNFNGTLPSNHFGGMTSTKGSDPSNTALVQETQTIQNAQTIYIDVHRIGYVTFNGNSTIVMLADYDVIEHIELTKNGDQFVYGEVPSEMQKPNP